MFLVILVECWLFFTFPSAQKDVKSSAKSGQPRQRGMRTRRNCPERLWKTEKSGMLGVISVIQEVAGQSVAGRTESSSFTSFVPALLQRYSLKLLFL